MTSRHGFRLEKEQEIGELRTRVSLFRHGKTGAELLSLVNDDENKVFGITFRTPPADSTGVAHILEHSVLCGSRKYPVKEPFVELLKGSLHTFLNAFTYPDKTCYPVASQNHRDFHHLIDVYLDAVFHPRLTPHVFRQEGWHFESEGESSPLTYKGVVFNEMKGAYASPDNMLSRYALQSLFPDTPYGHDAGGDPVQIPRLTFERFKAFHERYYHPSNALIFFCGDDDPGARLKVVDEYLRDFDMLEVASEIPLQPTFSRPLRLEKAYMAGLEPDPKGMVTLNWLLPESSDIPSNFAFRILEYILLGMPASPLRKALIDSGLGEDLAGEGLGTELRQMYLSTGLKGVRPRDADAVETLILETIAGLADRGIHPHTVEAAVNTIEFRFRENNAGHFPRGLMLMLRSLTTWLYGGDPVALLAFEGPLREVKTRIEANAGFLQDLIRGFLLENPHRTTLLLEPDPGLRKRYEEEEKIRLELARTEMLPPERMEVVENARELKRRQEEPDPPEALASIPTLKLTDLDPQNKPIPILRAETCGTPIFCHDIFTHGVAYLDAGFDLHRLPGPLLPYVPLFGRALVEMGTETEDFVALTQRISRKTGGIRPHCFTSGVKGEARSAAWLFLRGKAMAGRLNELTGILRDVLLGLRLDNPDRFGQMVMEEKARMEERLIPSGHQILNLRLRAHFGEAHWAAEQMGGITYLLFLRDLARRVREEWPSVHEELEEIRGILVNRDTMALNLTLHQDLWHEARALLDGLLNALPATGRPEAVWSPEEPPRFEGMTIPSQVNYVGKAVNLYALGYRFHGSSLPVTRYLRNAWLWDRVRVQGGAYGAFCTFDRFSGALTLVSYRDPNLLGTLEIFDACSDFLRDTPVHNDERGKSIIGAIGDLDAHMLPDAKGYASLLRFLSGETDEDRQVIREEVLGTTQEQFGRFGEALAGLKDQGIVKVLGSPDAIEAAGASNAGRLSILKLL